MRRKRKFKREIEPDSVCDSVLVAQFINHLMKNGKKSVARKTIYRAFEIIKEKTKKEPLDVFDLAIKNTSPLVEVRSRRIGGARYQVPREVRGERKIALSIRWLMQAANGKKGRPMAEKLAEEFILASKNEGAAVKKREETHKIADANKAFAHFGW